MALEFAAENEHAQLFTKTHCFKSIAEFEISFKGNMTCLKRCKEVSKELFDKLMLHLKDYVMKAKLSTEIEYEYCISKDDVMKKTATYHSSKDVRYLFLENSHQFYHKNMNALIQRYRQYLSIPQVNVIKVKWIVISVSCFPKHKNRRKPMKLQPITRVRIPTRKQLTDPYHRKMLNRH